MKSEEDKKKIRDIYFDSADRAYSRAVEIHDAYVTEIKKTTINKRKIAEAANRTVASNDIATRSAFAEMTGEFKSVSREKCVNFWNKKTSGYGKDKNDLKSGEYKLVSSGGMDGKGNEKVEGSYLASHAEKKMVVEHNPNKDIMDDKDFISDETLDQNTPFGINKEQCGDCRQAMRDFSKQNKCTFIARDPKSYRVYNPDGSVEIYNTDRDLLKKVNYGDVPKAKMTGKSYKKEVW